MGERSTARHRILSENNWQNAQITPLAGDASSRRYLRLLKPDGTRALLMDAPPSVAGPTGPFLDMAAWLCQIGLSAPKIYAEDQTHGFLLLEDFGDALFADVLKKQPRRETALYLAATDALLHLQTQTAPPNLIAYDPAMMTAYLKPYFTDYLPAVNRSPTQSQVDKIQAEILRLLHRHAAETNVVILRDFHAENLIWLEDRSNLQQPGLLDFQDAMAGHRAYDLVSLLEDARRDVSPTTHVTVIAHYAQQSGIDAKALGQAMAILGAQRNLRIIGIFARVILAQGKPRYIDLIPRVWRHLMCDLAHPGLSPLKALCQDVLIAPTPETLQHLRDKCPTRPAP